MLHLVPVLEFPPCPLLCPFALFFLVILSMRCSLLLSCCGFWFTLAGGVHFSAYYLGIQYLRACLPSVVACFLSSLMINVLLLLLSFCHLCFCATVIFGCFFLLLLSASLVSFPFSPVVVHLVFPRIPSVLLLSPTLVTISALPSFSPGCDF
jgi:hypothetical protein